jgi:phosphohistidine phosphatase
MKIYLVQHGNQNPEEIDPNEGLSDKGNNDVEKVAKFLTRINVKPSKIFHSVKLRAKQTAEIFAKHLDSETQEMEGLKPMDDIAFWIEKLEDGLMLVGHLPFMQRFTSLLICANSEKPAVNFHQGGVVCMVKDEEKNWRIDFMVTPEIL